jgi:DNA-binding transcriptional LysR family regulator
MFDRHSLEDALSRAGMAPRLRITMPHAMALPAMLRDSDMMSVVPSLLARRFVQSGGLVARQPPYRAPTVTLRALWHQRHEHDPAHKWLRAQVTRAAATL